MSSYVNYDLIFGIEKKTEILIYCKSFSILALKTFFCGTENPVCIGKIGCLILVHVPVIAEEGVHRKYIQNVLTDISGI